MTENDNEQVEAGLGQCPICGEQDWEYTEVEIWPGRRCQSCGARLLHADLVLPDGQER